MGVIDLYQGERGRQYFSHSEGMGAKAALRHTFIWGPYVEPEDHVVEFGCGGGDLLASLKCRYKAGVEINPAARDHARGFGLHIIANLAELPEREFTLAISSHALEHVASPHQVLCDLRRVLKPRGTVLLLLPMDDWRHYTHRHWKRGDGDMHLYAWTPLTLGNLLVSAGFRPAEIRIVNHTWPPRIDDLLWRLSPRLFHAAALVASVALRRRQLFARAIVD
jgi:SAM-dependent methyltransferase